MKTFVLPDLGEGLAEAEIVAWHVGEGDHVVADQPLVSVETEKAVVEVPSPLAGRIARLFGRPGDRVAVGAPLSEYEEGPHADTGTVVGELSGAPLPPKHRLQPAIAPASVKATPVVRALARQHGVDLTRVAPSGPTGTITRKDVMRSAEAAGPPEGRQPLRGVRRAMAVNMARAHAAVAPASLFDEAEVEGWYPQGIDVTLRLLRAVAAGVAASPDLNCWFDAAEMERQVHAQIDLGIAVDSREGLIVPVLRNVGRYDADALRQELERLKAMVRDRTVPLERLRGATITLSNFGSLSGGHAILVVLPPQVAILGAGRISQRAFPEGAGVAFRHVIPLSLTFDHRVVTGGEAARFLTAAVEDLQRPA